MAGLSCPKCGRTLDHGIRQTVCPCGSPLLVDYDLETLGRHVDKSEISSGPPTMWRYCSFLPVASSRYVVSLGEGFTPLVPAPTLGRRIGLPRLLVKDEGLNPTGTFKARGASCGASMAVQLGIRRVALPTAGNAGGAWACYGAAAALDVHVVMPKDAPHPNVLECELFGADVTFVDGTISEAGELVGEMAEGGEWFEVSTLREPYRVEGKKTLGLEIAEQLGWSMPDAIICPVGGGVGVIGIWRALTQLQALGWLKGDRTRLVAAQAEGCAPIVEALARDREAPVTWPHPLTFAHGLRVPSPLGGYLVLRAIRETGGTAVAVSDDDIARGMAELGMAGFSACPEGAASLAAAHRLREQGDLSQEDSVVLVNTGNALKYPDQVARAVRG